MDPVPEINFAEGVVMRLKQMDDGSIEILYTRKNATLMSKTMGKGYMVELGPLLRALYWESEKGATPSQSSKA